MGFDELQTKQNGCSSWAIRGAPGRAPVELGQFMEITQAVQIPTTERKAHSRRGGLRIEIDIVQVC
jgi:hypothetical protein